MAVELRTKSDGSNIKKRDLIVISGRTVWKPSALW